MFGVVGVVCVVGVVGGFVGVVNVAAAGVDNVAADGGECPVPFFL